MTSVPAPVDALREVEATMRRLVRADGASPVLADIAVEHLDTGGKRLRARLALSATATLGGAESLGIRWAAACELAHNATLIHDDLQDGDQMRRGQPTTWVRHGAAQAINAGDLLLMVPFLALQAAPGQNSVDATLGFALQQSLAGHMTQVIRGQAVELALGAHGSTDRQAYRDMVLGKTAALFELPVHGAALIAGCDGPQAARLVVPFACLGALFQMQDDVLDLYGKKGREHRGSDLREGKISALVVEHLALHPGDRAWLLDMLRLPRNSTPQPAVQEAIDRFAHGGALAAVLGAIEAAAQQARAQVDPRLRPLLHGLLQRIMEPIAHLTTPGARRP